MSIGKSEGILQKITDISQEIDIKGEADISSIIIPFSKVFKSNKQIDIYSGAEKIPFKERDLEYKMILKQEFGNLL
jgi:hypothetical protein